tara:strand:- start:293 stop:622 length:330 start_codon:yes stop_codon:yes gene_type:complete
MNLEVTEEQRKQDLNEFDEIVERCETLLIWLAKRRAKHTEVVIVLNSKTDEQLAEKYREASETLKHMINQLKPIGDELEKLQPDPPPFFVLRLINFMLGRKPRRKALTA